MAPNLQQRFSPVELSEVSLEHDGLRHLTFYSPALGGRGDVSVFIPRGTIFPVEFPLVVLLHGVYGSHWAWFFKGAAHRTAQAMIDAGEIRPMMIATPSDGLSGDGSGYWPRPARDAERWIVEDVCACVREQFPSRGPLYLSGLSMGDMVPFALGASMRASSRESPRTLPSRERSRCLILCESAICAWTRWNPESLTSYSGRRSIFMKFQLCASIAGAKTRCSRPTRNLIGS